MSLLQGLIQQLEGGLWDIRNTRYCALAASTVIIWEHITTLDLEVELIWQRRWTPGTFIFFCNRYYVLAAVFFNVTILFTNQLNDDLCSRWFHWQGWTGLITCMLAEVIMQKRLWILYLKSKKILALMLVGFVASSATSAVVMADALSNFQVNSHPVPGLITFCTPSNIDDHFYTFWIPIIAFETMLCGLALFRGFQTFCATEKMFRSGRQLVNILVKDSVIYYLLILSAYLANLLIWMSSAEQNLTEIAVAFAVAMSSVMGNRLLFNMRNIRNQIEPQGFDSSTITSRSRPRLTTMELEDSKSDEDRDGDSFYLTEFEMEPIGSDDEEYGDGSGFGLGSSHSPPISVYLGEQSQTSKS